ncbi:metallophosphoesterase family protein [Roseateles sp. BYS87W]|uniref:Metallophosphoesterase family protein n=1 Tax=Pelomonas baiyunensis TaxID=3299026 RepID=A0ABW7H083_9BURK
MPRRLRPLLLMAAAGLLLAASHAQDGRPRGRPGPPPERQGPAHQPAPFTAQPEVDVVPGRPEATAVTLSLRAARRDEAVVLRWQAREPDAAGGERRLTLRQGEPLLLRLDGLAADRAYRYELRAEDGRTLAQGGWHTARAAGASFTVTLTADSHLDQNTDPTLYQRTLAAARADAPDFHIDLGDTFMVDKHASREAAAAQYAQQHHYLGQLGLPVFLVLGNHDGEEAKLRRGSDSLADWANAMRRRHFANPEPGYIYTGDETRHPDGARLQDYYAWTWGDTLFVVLNPYWHGPTGRSDDRWGLSLGEAQTRWLRDTLQHSRARHKLVFVHQLLGGLDRQGRGGVEAAGYGEWGGRNADGSDGLAAHRPGWAEPIHALLRRTGVTAVFHGHDHLFAWQSLDGIAYVEVPQPGHSGPGHTQAGADYGYRSGVVRGEGGYLRLRCTPERVIAEYVATEGASPRVLHRAELGAP